MAKKIVISQNCLDVQPVKQFVKDLPEGISVKTMSWRAYEGRKRSKLAIPAYLVRLGMTVGYLTGNEVEVSGKFTDMDNEKLLKAVTRIGRSYKMAETKFTIRLVTVQDKAGNIVTFKRMYKQIKLPNDKRKKKLVLGMTTIVKGLSGPILVALSAKKISCTLMKVEKTIVMCSEEVVI